MVVSLSKGLRSLSQHRGCDDSTDSRQGKDDSRITMLPTLSRLAHLVEDRLDPSGHIVLLLLQKAQPRELQKNMLAGRFHCPWRQLQRRSVQSGQYFLRAETPDSMFFQESLDLGASQLAHRFRLRRAFN